MELRHLHSFIVLADELHFGRAAERLGLTQSAVTRHVQLLETELRFRIVDRSSRRVVLTRAGQTLRDRIEPQVEALTLTIKECRGLDHAKIGRLRIGYVANLSYVFLPRLLRRLRQRSPGARFELHELPTPRQLESLHARRIDLGIALAPLDDPDVMQRWLFDERLGVMMCAQHPLRSHRSLELKQLANEPFVICPRYVRTGLHEVVKQRCLESGFEPVVAQEVGGPALLDQLVAAGVGISIVPESAAEVPRTGVIFRPLRGKITPLQVHAIWRKDSREPLLRPALDIAAEVAETWREERAPQAFSQQAATRCAEG